MNFNETVKLVEGAIVIAGVASLIFVSFKSATTKATIVAQKDLIETLTTQVKELRSLHLDNEKAISELKGQVSVYKELPLSELSNSMRELAQAQKEIFKLIKNR